MRDELLAYYERELIFLRRMGAEFARRYPKIAARLELSEEKIEDPHVERLIEAFAFLTGRIGLKLDDELPEITEAFFNVLYPHYLAPIPSMSIVQMNYGSPHDKLTAVQKMDAGTRLNSRPIDGSPCRFRTAYDVDLMPIEVESASLESPAPKDGRGRFATAQIRIGMRCYGNSRLSELRRSSLEDVPTTLRFYIDGDPQLVYPLYELIFNNAVTVQFRAKEAPIGSQTIEHIQLRLPDPVVLQAKDAIKQVGFAENEAMLPYTKRSFMGYRLLTEYFAFPYKFLFFDVEGLDRAIAANFGSHFELVIDVKDIVPPSAPVTADTFRLGCTPIVNLFSRLSDPIYLSQQRYEYQVIPDVHRQNSTEIYSVDEVITSDPRTNTTREFSPFYSMRHAYGEQMEKSFWYTVRRQSQRPDDEGTEIFMSLVDMNFDPNVPAVEVLNVKTTCTNRDLPAKLPFGGKEGDFEIEGTALLSRVKCLTKPTETLRPPQRRSAHWRLISHLNLNYLSIVGDNNGSAEALQEILHLYNFNDSAITRKQILGITGISSRKVVRQIGQRVGAGFVRGIETTLTFDEEQFVGSGLFLFACVIEHFLGLYAGINSFNQTVVRTDQREEELCRFPPRAGEQELL
ncbi:MAG: type VI secretion system baseplate subunit TssF [Chloracidobacterium sp.]|nr:type VI secretion system baseplate subunit TssF [Chloracidobacterium sp.]MCC6825804.1 type VI secretion system baseplate subunit TssF [Acidobacteriota bacterium]MCO5332959.1 type VI secretion system baseplate subunit TssF [Pyrinomonadaceae bacterium]